MQPVMPAHTPVVVAATCVDRSAALRVAHDFAEQTEHSDRVKVCLDRTRVIDRRDRWEVWTLVGQGRPTFIGEEAYLVVRKSDCGTNWGLVLYEE
jgi:hypothetical protein